MLVKLPKMNTIDFQNKKNILQPLVTNLTLEKAGLENEIHGKLTFEKLCGNFMPLIQEPVTLKKRDTSIQGDNQRIEQFPRIE